MGIKKADYEKIKELVEKGNSQNDIAQINHVGQPQVSKIIKKLGLKKQQLNTFKDNKVDIFLQDQKENGEIQTLIRATWTKDSIASMTENHKKGIFQACTMDTAIKQDKIKDINALQPIKIEKLVFTVVNHANPPIDTKPSNTGQSESKIDTKADNVANDTVIDI